SAAPVDRAPPAPLPRRHAAPERSHVLEGARHDDPVLAVDGEPAAGLLPRHPGQAVTERPRGELPGGAPDQPPAFPVDHLPRLRVGPADPCGAVTERLDLRAPIL